MLEGDRRGQHRVRIDDQYRVCFRRTESSGAGGGVAFEGARTVVADPRSSSVPDPRHSRSEARFANLGRSARGRLLAMFYTERGPRTRIISAREATRRERGTYERATS